MPLLDHFRPPVTSRKAWESFHKTWSALIAIRLNAGGLPDPFESEPGVHLGPLVEVDVATFEEDEDPSLLNGVHGDENGGGGPPFRRCMPRQPHRSRGW